MTAEQMAEELIQRHGLPKSLELYKALLEYAFAAGQLQGGVRFGHALQTVFEKVGQPS